MTDPAPTTNPRKSAVVQLRAGSITVLHIVSCYTEECSAALKLEGQVPAQRVVAQARAHGWGMLRGKWFCGGCYAVGKNMVKALEKGTHLE